ncbi:MAG: CHRD domain-containing protein [Chloroflexi bacterium]|nr:MAG: CHRD domain-containing protein [Chloroflexota bacterium]
MRRLSVALATAALTFAAMGIAAVADAPPPTTFVAVLNADEEVPHCAAATNASRGLAVFHVTDEATGTVEYTLVANNLPGNITNAHIHVAPKGVAGMVVQGLAPTAGEENGVIKKGSFTNPALVAAIRANENGYYVNVHSTVCPGGVIRGQLGDHGP